MTAYFTISIIKRLKFLVKKKCLFSKICNGYIYFYLQNDNELVTQLVFNVIWTLQHCCCNQEKTNKLQYPKCFSLLFKATKFGRSLNCMILNLLVVLLCFSG